MAKLALPLPMAEQLCVAGFEGDVAILTPALQGFPGGRRNTSSFSQSQQIGWFPSAQRSCKCHEFLWEFPPYFKSPKIYGIPQLFLTL